MKVSIMRIFLLVAMLSSLETPCMGMFTKIAPVARSARTLTRRASNYSPELEQWLLKNKFTNPHDERRQDITMYDGWETENNRWTRSFIHPIHLALAEKNILILYKLIFEQSVNVNSKDQNDLTPLMALLNSCNDQEWIKKNRQGSTESAHDQDLWDYESPEALMLFRFLIIVDSDVNATTKHGTTALHIAANGGNNALPFVELLLNEGAEVNAKDRHDFTPLHIAAGCIRDSLEIVALLRTWGADLNAVNNQPYLNNPKTPLQWAEFCNNKFYYGSLRSDYYPTLRRLLNPNNVGPNSGE